MVQFKLNTMKVCRRLLHSLFAALARDLTLQALLEGTAILLKLRTPQNPSISAN